MQIKAAVGTEVVGYCKDPTLVPRPFSGLWLKFQASSPVFRAFYLQSAHFSDYFVNLFDVSTEHQRCFSSTALPDYFLGSFCKVSDVRFLRI